MTDIFTAVKAILAPGPTILAALAGGGIWSYWPRKYKTPCLIIECDKDDESNQLTGASPSGMVEHVLTITCRASDPDGGPQADALRQAVRNLLSGQSIGGMDFILEDTTRAAVPKSEGSVDHWYDQVMSFSVMRMEAIGA